MNKDLLRQFGNRLSYLEAIGKDAGYLKNKSSEIQNSVEAAINDNVEAYKELLVRFSL